MQAPRTTPDIAVDEQPEVQRASPLGGVAPDGGLAAQAALAGRLADLHFSAQHEATDLRDAPITQLDSFLRGLLFTDGTVSRALEAHTLCAVAVEPVEQEPGPTPARITRHLELEGNEECLRRRVLMKIGASQLTSVWAESFVVPERLPAGFLAHLSDDTQGIGGSIQQLKLESRRELLWFGLGASPPWALDTTPVRTTLTRAYRVMTQGLPALLICEAFAVELRSRRYHLAGAGPASG
jgi:chorismate-pyruvate lyase